MEPLGILVKSILAFTIAVDAFLIVYIATGKQRGLIPTLFLIHLLGIIGWAGSILFILQFGDYTAARFSFICALVFAAAKYYFVLIFPENRLPKKIWHFIPLLLAIIALVFAAIPGMVFKNVMVVDGYYMNVDNGPFSAAYSLIITFLLVFPIFALARKYFKETYSPHTKEQIKYLCIGSAFFFLISLSTNLILPVYFKIYFFNGLGPVFSLIFVGFILLTISRHHFLGLRLIIQRGFIYSVLFFFIICFYLAIITLTGFFIQQITATAILINAGITSLFGIFTVPYIDRFLRKKTDRFFFKDTYDYAETLYALSEEINKSVQIDDIKARTETSLQNIFKTNEATVRFVRGDEIPALKNQFERTHASKITIPIIFNETIIGTIHLGEKHSGDHYTHEDIVLIRTFSYQIAAAFEKAKLYSEVQQYSRELEKRVEERTEQITKLQEQQTQMMLDISHKLQTPLTIAKAQLNRMRKGTPEEVSFDLFEKTLDDTSAFVYDLLDLARLEAIPSDNLEKEPYNLSEHLSELAEYFSVMAKQNGIEFRSKVAPEVYFTCNKTKITELFTNLVSNAVKYSDQEKKERWIELCLWQTDASVCLAVSDNGIGIAKADIPLVFDRFYRTPETRSIHGTGLGLAICKKIVELHNGTIQVESTREHGTVFTMTFPPSTRHSEAL
jgi:signal transduction histidine kinase